MATPSSRLEIVPLGGLGEFGMNLMVLRLGGDCLVVDAGMMFPGAEHLGVDVVIPDMSFLEICGTIHGLVLTHGHEDHIGAVPFLLARHDVPVYGTPYTLGLVRERLAEHDLSRRRPLRPLPTTGDPVILGPFAVEAIPVTHSIPQSTMLAIRTAAGTVVHTADFKLDPFPIGGEGTDLARLARLGDEGVLALLSDSTNADRPGFTPAERTVAPGLERRIAGAQGRVFVTTFSSNIHRIQQVVDVAVRHGRRVALVGASIQNHVEVAERLGLFRIPAGVRAEAFELMDAPSSHGLFLVTGSQGEPMSALARIAVDRHREVGVEAGDVVLHSARVIPGNEKAVGRMMDHLLRRGADVVTAAEAPIHVSGHPAREELRLMLHLLRPAMLVPIHGEYRQLVAHAAIGRECGLPPESVAVIESGSVLAVDADGCEVVDHVPVGHVYIDGALDEVDPLALRDRRQVAGDGIVVTVVAVDPERGAIAGLPEIVSRGFVSGEAEEEILRDARACVTAALAECTPEERTDEGLMKAKVQTELKRFLRRRTQKRPLIIPVIVES